MKLAKKLFIMTLVLVMLAGMLPLSILALVIQVAHADEPLPRAIQLAQYGLQLNDAQKSSIYFGAYEQDYQNISSGGYFLRQNIKWRLLKKTSNTLLLLSDKILDHHEYHPQSLDGASWANSSMRGWLNDDGSGFLATAFNGKERAAMVKTIVKNIDSVPPAGEIDTKDKIFLLSDMEVRSSTYGFTDNTARNAYETTYAWMQYDSSRTMDYYYRLLDYDPSRINAPRNWWLRSPGLGFAGSKDYVSDSGEVVDNFFMGGMGNRFGVRPALNIDLSQVLFISAYGPAKNAANNAKILSYDLRAITEYSGSTWKLTLLDRSRSGFKAQYVGEEDDYYMVQYSGATTGDYEFISAIVTDNLGNVKYYGRLQNVERSGDASGTVWIENKYVGAGDKLYVFNEHHDGRYEFYTYKESATDWASPLVEVTAKEDNTPIIIIPGIMGSRLFTSNTMFNDSTRLWNPVVAGLSTTYGSLDKLRNGITGTVYVRPCENQHKYSGGGDANEYGREYGSQDIYQDIVDQLCEEFPDREIYFFSYDWRQSNADSASKLNDFILSLDAEKVDLVCHSMGGLVASSYYANYRNEGKLGKVITCGTPYEGAPKILNSIMNWDVVSQGANPFTDSGKQDLALAILGGLTADVKASFQGVAELTPSYNYCQKIPMWRDSWRPFSAGDYKLSYKDYVNICNNIFGIDKFSDAIRFQTSLYNDNGYNTLLDYDNSYFIIGINQITITAVKFQFINNDIDELLYESDLSYSTRGDGTVPYYSASICEKVEGLKKNNRWFTYATDHVGAITSEVSRDAIVSLLKGTDGAPSSSEPAGRSYTVIRVACPVDATIERNGELLSSGKEQFSVNASFGRLDILGENDEVKMFCVFTEEETDLQIKGTDVGKMNLSVHYYDEADNLIEEYVFEDVAITGDTIIATDIGHSEAPVLSVDQDGDGFIDEYISGEKDIYITLDANGGKVNGKTIDTVTTGLDGKLTSLPEATHDNVKMQFLGWFTAASGGTEVKVNDTVFAGNDTIYAHWTSIGGGVTTQYTLTYQTNGGSALASTKHSSGTTVKLTALPTREGYTFDGWHSDTALTDRVTSIRMDGDKTVYAGWKENATLDHDCSSKHLKDVSADAWYHACVDYVIENGLMYGIADDRFGPDVTTSRAMIVTILYHLEGSPAVGGAKPFDDVAAVSWYADAVAWAEEKDIVNGYGNGKFGPDDLITREQFAAILFGYAAFKDYDVSKSADLSKYTDAGDISDWSLPAMKWANAEGLITGRTVTTLVPKGDATRAEAAAILMQFLENVKK